MAAAFVTISESEGQRFTSGSTRLEEFTIQIALEKVAFTNEFMTIAEGQVN